MKHSLFLTAALAIGLSLGCSGYRQLQYRGGLRGETRAQVGGEGLESRSARVARAKGVGSKAPLVRKKL